MLRPAPTSTHYYATKSSNQHAVSMHSRAVAQLPSSRLLPAEGPPRRAHALSVTGRRRCTCAVATPASDPAGGIPSTSGSGRVLVVTTAATVVATATAATANVATALPAGLTGGAAAPRASLGYPEPPLGLSLGSSLGQVAGLELHPPSEPGNPDPKKDLVRALAVCAVVAALAVATETNREWIGSNQEGVMVVVFLLGYAGIVLEEIVDLNKAGVALVMAAALWSVRACGSAGVELEVKAALAEVSEVVFFLLCAMTVVEVVDSHQGFRMISRKITTNSKVGLLWVVGIISFVLSSMLDNLTTTIVMISLLARVCPDVDTRRYLGAVVVIAANAGGAWSPIGDVTTTMLWVEGQITPLPTMTHLFIPSVIALVTPLTAMSLLSPELKAGGDLLRQPIPEYMEDATSSVLASVGGEPLEDDTPPRGQLVLFAGMGSLLLVPVFKVITGLPPYMGMLAGLGFLWLFTDALHFGEDRNHLKVSSALKEIDITGTLFFLGILLAIAALNAAGLLKEIAFFLDAHVPSEELVAGIIGFASALVDNVPLVAATQGMYTLADHPPDSPLWQLIAYCAGTGGSLLIIGSSAGVAYMGLSKGATFGWYARRVAPWALLGYLSGLAAYIGLNGDALMADQTRVTALMTVGM